jgi:hypothetical protein
MFRSIQGLTTLAEQQPAALNGLINNFIVDIGVTGPLTVESIAALDPSTHAISGYYAVSFLSVHEFLCGFATRVDTLINKSLESKQKDLQRDIGLV